MVKAVINSILLSLSGVTTVSWCLRGREFDTLRGKSLTEFSNGDTEDRYIREIVFGKRRNIRYWQITTDKVELRDTTWFIMTNLPGDVQNQSVIPMG